MIKQQYYDWISSLAIPDGFAREQYSQLLNALHHISFHFTLPLDENRKVDGMHLRRRFAYEKGYSIDYIKVHLYNNECSMLEMMVALALRVEENIMNDYTKGNRLSVWFSDMICNLKLDCMDNSQFDISYVESRIDILLNHKYEPTGEGSLFSLNRPGVDIRNVEIWYQMMWYMDSILKN